MKMSILIKIVIILMNLTVIPLIVYNPYAALNKYEAVVLDVLDLPNTDLIAVTMEIQPSREIYVQNFNAYLRTFFEDDSTVMVEARMVDIKPHPGMIVAFIILPLAYILFVILMDIYLTAKYIRKKVPKC